MILGIEVCIVGLVKIKVCLLAVFFFFCNLQAKDIYLDLEVDLPNRSSVSIHYHDQINHFSAGDLANGVTRKNVFDIVFFSNVKEPLEIILSSKDAEEDMFSFVEEKTKRRLPFNLFCMDGKSNIKNGTSLYSEDNIKGPISKVISIGMEVPKLQSKKGINGQLSTCFTVILQHIG